VGQQQQQPTPILNRIGQKQQEQGAEALTSSTSVTEGQVRQMRE
jgi:hypothetical protein